MREAIMRPLWYGDRRDRVKWGALLYLADTLKLSTVVQVAYWRDKPNPDERTLELGNGHGEVPIPEAVWNHFSNLRNIEQLQRVTGYTIVVCDNVFEIAKREEYADRIIARLGDLPRPRLLFLDPDTGIQTGESAGVQHVAVADIQKFWTALDPGDVLAVYQHAGRRKAWFHKKQEQLRRTCKGARVSIIRSEIARDIAMLWTRRS